MVTKDSTRFTRVQSRGRTGDPDTFESFQAADTRAAGNDAFQQNQVLINHADVKLVNDGSFEDLQEAIASVVQDIIKRDTESA